MATGRPVHADSRGRPGCRTHAENAQWQQVGQCMQILVVGQHIVYILRTEGPLYHSTLYIIAILPQHFHTTGQSIDNINVCSPATPCSTYIHTSLTYRPAHYYQ